jgi:diguanylate cyclase (GGDEF)-like protein
MQSLLKDKILVVDDNSKEREQLKALLEEKYEVDLAEDGQQALDIIKNGYIYDLILLDLLMPKVDGYTVLRKCKADEVTKKTPIVVMTDEMESEEECLKLGATDFLSKPIVVPEIVFARIGRLIELYKTRRIVQSTEKDELTGTYTNKYFFEYAPGLAKATPKTKMDAIVVDTDKFRYINELFGRDYGDLVLQNIANSILEYVGTDGIVSRIAGDTFYVLYKHSNSHERFLRFLMHGLEEIDKINPNNLRMGIYENVPFDEDVETWFAKARDACKEVRGNFVNRIGIYDEALHSDVSFNNKLINDFEEALQQNQFEVYYQPMFNVTGERPILKSAEALVRWNHPELGFISPGKFVPLFEKNGIISRLDYYIWNEVARQIQEWKEEFDNMIPISVNVSRVDTLNPDLDTDIEMILEKRGLTAQDLLIEITESAFSENVQLLTSLTKKLGEKGFRVEMDDFGTGYSSLGMLMDVHFDALKIDMSFIRGMESSDEKQKMVKKIIEIARLLNLNTIAEGVEKEEQLNVLKHIGCEIIQGFYFSKPVPKDKFKEILDRELGSIES